MHAFTCLVFAGVNACSRLLQEQQQLERMFFNNNGLDTAAAQRIQEIMLHQKPTKLRLFHCFNNLLRDGGASALAPVLANSPDLTDVRFSATRFGVKGGLAISEALQHTPLLGTWFVPFFCCFHFCLLLCLTRACGLSSFAVPARDQCFSLFVSLSLRAC